MTQVVRARFVRCAGVISALVCALATSRVDADDAPPPLDSEAAKIDAAKHHPVAQPEARPLYPTEQPPAREQREPPAEAPAPHAPRAPTPALAPRSVEAPVYPGQTYPAQVAPHAALATELGVDEEVVAPQAPPPPPEENVLAAPAPGYVWAPGYWYWYGGNYVWIGGSWLPPRPGYVYVGAHWVHGYNGWVFSTGGWSIGGGIVVYPTYAHSYLWTHPHAGYHYGHDGYYGGHPHGGHYAHGGHYYAPSHGHGYPSTYRRNAPAAYGSHPGYHGTPHYAPHYGAPSSYPRGGRSVHVHPRH